LKMPPPGPALEHLALASLSASGGSSSGSDVLCRQLHPHHQDHLEYPDHDIHPSTLGQGIELIFIDIDS
jgi:hypothetical protein